MVNVLLAVNHLLPSFGVVPSTGWHTIAAKIITKTAFQKETFWEK